MDPKMLAAIANPTPYPGSPPNPVTRVPGAAPGAPGAATPEPPKTEAAQLAELGRKAQEALKAARDAHDELAAAVEMADNIDPKLEKTITAMSDDLAKLDDQCTQMCEDLDAAEEDQESMISGDGGDAAAG